jgi:anti-sigma regulatory factor (Ser/Thr protein kinase)
MRDPILIEVTESSAVGEVRRAVSSLAGDFGFDADAVGRLSVIATELATNVVKHAGRGFVLIGPDDVGANAIEVIAVDAGPGIANVAEALRDGHSTTATAGNGLGAISRMANFFDLYSLQKSGTAILARVAREGQKMRAAQIGGISVAVRGETVNGDGWQCAAADGVITIMVVDGLGHGLPAHEASIAAGVAFLAAKGPPAEQLRTVHDAIKRTRGAAVAIAELDAKKGSMRYCGAGNISATMIDPAARRSAVSLYGIVGHDVRDFREFSYPWSHDSTLIMHSDGLTTRWDLDRYAGLLGHDAALIAAVLWKDHRRQNDDSTVVVARTP